MHMMRAFWTTTVACAAVAAVVLTGCGAKETSGDTNGAQIAAASTPAFLSIDTDPKSAQWQLVDDLLDSFPGKPHLLEFIRSSLLGEMRLDYERDVRPALGPEIDLAWLDFEAGGSNVVALTQPKDEDAFKRMARQLARPDPVAFGKVGDWLVFSDTKAKVDRFRDQANSGDKLAEHKEFQAALAELPDESLVYGYAGGNDLTEAFRKVAEGVPGYSQEGDLEFMATALVAEEKGLRWVLVTRGENDLKNTRPEFKSGLVHEVPADALAFVAMSRADLGKSLKQASPGERQGLGVLEGMLGFRLGSLAGLLENEAAFYARPQVPVPELTLLVKSPNERRALTQAHEILSGLARTVGGKPGRRVKQAGVGLRTLSFDGFLVHYGAFDGKLVVTSGKAAIDELRSNGEKLADDDDYRRALTTAGAPDENNLLMYLNIKRIVSSLRLYSLLESGGADKELYENLAPLRSFVLWGETDARTSTVTAFLQIDRSK